MPTLPPGWFEFKNADSTQVPGRGVMRVTGVSVLRAGRIILTCAQPNSFGDTGSCMLNGPVAVDAGKLGLCTRMAPNLGGGVVAKYDFTDGSPAYGDSWGPRNGTWNLRKNTGGFFALGVPTNTTQFLAMFLPMPMHRIRGKANADITSGAVGTVDIFYRSGATAYLDTGVNTPTNSVLNDLDDTVKNGSVVECVYEPYFDGTNNVEGWKIIQAAFSC